MTLQRVLADIPPPPLRQAAREIVHNKTRLVLGAPKGADVGDILITTVRRR